MKHPKQLRSGDLNAEDGPQAPKHTSKEASSSSVNSLMSISLQFTSDFACHKMPQGKLRSTVQCAASFRAADQAMPPSLQGLKPFSYFWWSPKHRFTPEANG